MQLRIFCPGLLQDGNVGISVLPEREETLLHGAGLGGVTFQNVGAGESWMRQCADGFVLYSAAVVEDFLELGRCFAALMRG